MTSAAYESGLNLMLLEYSRQKYATEARVLQIHRAGSERSKSRP